MIASLPGVEEAMAEVTDNALLISNGKEMPITLKGVSPEVFARITTIDSLILDGTPVSTYAPPQSSISVGVAQRLGIFAAGDTLLIFAPKRFGRVNMSNPVSSFITDSLHVASIFRSMQSEFDENTVICDISTARDLFQYDTEATSVLVKAKPGVEPSKLSEEIKEKVGDEYIVKDRLQQQAMNFRMVAIEKWITFILLSFILVIASFNIISTLCMIILDKGQSIHTLSHLGLSRKRIGNIFWWESVFITLIGAVAGIGLGLIISLLQEKYGLIKLAGDPESLVILAYPVRVEWLDIGVTMIPVAIIGLITAWISFAFARARAKHTI